MRGDLLDLLTCPACLDGGLAGWDGTRPDGELRCAGCDAVYPVRRGIPILLPAGLDAAHIHDELDHGHEHSHKHQQAGYYSREVREEFEIARPHGAPLAYRQMLEEKFRRSVAALGSLAGVTVADVCCGSGMDAEMLERAGARVLAVDISEGCARRAKARAERYGLSYGVVVGDVERLPLRAASVGVSYVHDGLHHLADPAAGLREMARVAQRGVSINEPADAFATQIAVRLGLSINTEGAGNRVARLRADDTAEALRRAGFSDVRAERYLMYYRHEPGAFLRAASRPVANRLYLGGRAVADAALGRWGNKLQVTALRAA